MTESNVRETLAMKQMEEKDRQAKKTIVKQRRRKLKKKMEIMNGINSRKYRCRYSTVKILILGFSVQIGISRFTS